MNSTRLHHVHHILSMILQLPTSCKWKMQFWHEIFCLDNSNIYGKLHNWLRKLSRNVIQFCYQPFLLSFSFKMGVFLREFPVAMALLGKFSVDCLEKNPKKKHIFSCFKENLWLKYEFSIFKLPEKQFFKILKNLRIF